MTLKVFIAALCAIGLSSSVLMYRKGVRAERGLLTEPSVVQTPRARAVGGLPNALLGMAYYLLLAFLALFTHGKPLWITALAATYAAAAMSAYLAYSLLFVTKMPCRFCWTAHVVNLLLAVLVSLSYQW